MVEDVRLKPSALAAVGLPTVEGVLLKPSARPVVDHLAVQPGHLSRNLGQTLSQARIPKIQTHGPRLIYSAHCAPCVTALQVKLIQHYESCTSDGGMPHLQLWKEYLAKQVLPIPV